MAPALATVILLFSAALTTTAAPATTTAAATTVAPANATTSTWTAWDSSSGLSDSNSLGSLSGTNASSGSSNSFNEGSSVSGSSLPGHSSGDSSGSNASGSSGSYLQTWQWMVLIALCCAGGGGGAAAMAGGKKPAKKSIKKKLATPTASDALSSILSSKHAAGATKLQMVSQEGFAVGHRIVIDAGSPEEEVNEIVGFGSLILKTPTKFEHPAGARVALSDKAPAPEEVAVLEPLIAPKYSMPAAQPYAYVQQPMTTNYAYNAPTTSYVQPAVATYAQPATYTQPVTYAQPATYAQSATYAQPATYAQSQYIV